MVLLEYYNSWRYWTTISTRDKGIGGTLEYVYRKLIIQGNS